MKSKFYKLIVVLLTVTFMLPTVTFAVNAYDGIDNYGDVNYLSEELATELPSPEDIFSVYATPGETYAGYIFRLVENAIIPHSHNDGVQELFAPTNLFRANTIQDIMDFVAPEFIVYIEPDYIIYRDPLPVYEYIPQETVSFAPFAFASVSDPLYPRQWGLEHIRGAAAWSTIPAISTEGIVVAVIDSGIYRNHDDFNTANILRGRNFITEGCSEDECRPECDGNVCIPERDEFDLTDESGHGTVVTSVITAARDNDILIASMACGVTILPLRVFFGSGEPGDRERTQDSAVAAAINYAVDQGVDIINMSFSRSDQVEAIVEAVDRAAAANILMIATVGNWNAAAIRYPAGYANVIGVGAVNEHAERWVRADGTRGSNYNTSVFVTAPGANIHVLRPGNEFNTTNGTSVAAPKITALAAIARSHNRDMNATAFRVLLRRSAINRGAPGRDDVFGYGIIDVGLFMYNLTGNDFFQFGDVRNHWARRHIEENARYGLMQGRVVNYNRGRPHGTHLAYHPEQPMWRLEMAMALGRLHQLNGGAIPWENSSFRDVDNLNYFPFNYARFVNWAQAPDPQRPNFFIVQGFGNNNFRPGDAVTREQAAVFLYRFTTFLRGSSPAPPVIRTNAQAVLRAHRFPDYHQTSRYAEIALAWAVSEGLIVGRRTSQGNVLVPGTTITRAEGATLLSRYRQQFLEHTYMTVPVARLNLRVAGTENHRTHLAYLAQEIYQTYQETDYNTQVHQAEGDSYATHAPLDEAIPFTIPVLLSEGDIYNIPVLANENVSYFLSWHRGGAFYNGPDIGGYQFTGWYLDHALTQPLTQYTTMPETDLTLYASWESCPYYYQPSPPFPVYSWSQLQNLIHLMPEHASLTFAITQNMSAYDAGILGTSTITIPANRRVRLVGANESGYIDDTITRHLYQTNYRQRHFIVDGQLTLENISLTGLSTFEDIRNSGGVVVNGGGRLTMNEGSIIQRASWTDEGGAVVLNGRAPYSRANFYMNGGIIRYSMGHYAGAVYMRDYSSFAMLNGSELNHNHGYHAGGVFIGANSDLNMYANSRIYRNGALGSSYAAGGVSLTHSTSQFRSNNSQIIYNVQLHPYNNWGAGGVLVRYGVFMTNGGHISGNTSHMLWSAGGVMVVSGVFDMQYGYISNNTAHTGSSAGGVHVAGDSSALFILRDGTISNNNGPIGGVNMSAAQMVMYSGHIYGNTNSGVYLSTRMGTQDTLFTMHGGTIGSDSSYDYGGSNTGSSPNTATGRRGAGVHMGAGNPIFNMTGGTIAYNVQYGGEAANSGGGGIRIESGTFNMTSDGARIQHNQALGTHTTAGGGGIYQAGGRVNIHDGVISYNTASRGGGVRVQTPESQAFNMTNGWIWNNHATHNGGGIYTSQSEIVQGHLNLNISNVSFFENTAGRGSLLSETWLANITASSTSVSNYVLNNYDINHMHCDYYIGQTPVDFGYLHAAITQAETRTQQNYTYDSWAVLQTQLAAAIAVYRDNNTTQAQVDAATESLLAAIRVLEPINNQQPTHTGTLTTTPWRLYSDGTLWVQGGTINWRGGNSPWLPYSANVSRIVFTHPIEPGPYISSLFRGLSNVETIEGLENINTANVTSLMGMFLGTTSLVGVSGLSQWDTSNVTRMDFMFSGASSLVYGVDLSSWDTSNVTTMDRMFLNASALESLELSHWNTINVTDMSQMFRGASALVNIGDLSNWNTSNVRYMFSMFYNTSSLESLDLSGWETGKVVNMSNMFRNSHITTIGDVSRWNTSNVTSTSGMFFGASNLTWLELSGWNTENVANMSFMFSDTSSLTSVGNLSGWDTSRVTNMERMFRNASMLGSLSLSDWDMSAVENTFQMFSGAVSLRVLALGLNFRSNVLGSSALPAVSGNVAYTGKWQNVGHGTIDHPLGEYLLTSMELMDKYSSGFTATSDTWVIR